MGVYGVLISLENVLGGGGDTTLAMPLDLVETCIIPAHWWKHTRREKIEDAPESLYAISDRTTSRSQFHDIYASLSRRKFRMHQYLHSQE